MRNRMPDVHLHILREASACLLVLLYRAIPEPLTAERASSTALTLLLYTNHFIKAQT